MRHLPCTNSIPVHSLIVAVLFSIFVLSTPALADQLMINCPGGAPFVKVGDTSRHRVVASGGNGSPYSYFLVTSESPYISINQTSGLVTYVGDWYDYGLRCATVGVSDGADTALCSVCWMVGGGTSFKAIIEVAHNVSLGGTADIRIFLTRADTYRGLGGFDLLFALEPSVLSFMSAAPGSVYDSCGWEYFSYRLQEPCTGCPSGLVHLYGLAESNPLTPHPTCGWPSFNAHMPVTLASLRVRVAIDRDYECAFIPIRFFWTGCTDNAIWTHDHAYTTLASRILDYGNSYPIQDPQAGFPGYVGPPFDCDYYSDTLVITRDLELQNGGLDILCVDPIGQRGDINVNEYPYEIADAVMFSEYFLNGLGAFGPHVVASMAASDVNGDGETLKLPDLVYLVRIVLGDTPPIPKPVALQYAVVHSDGRTITVDNSPMLGAALITLKGNVVVESTQPDIRMVANFDGTNTRVLLTPPLDGEYSGSGFSGELLRSDNAEIVAAELVDYDGSPVMAKLELPQTFVLEQNYPNPFNNATTISFALPNDGDYILTVFNIAGQTVMTREGHAEKNREVRLSLDLTDVASGVYMYKLESDGQSATRKMLLLK